MENEAKLVDGQYELPLPFQDDGGKLPNNREQALKRLQSLKYKFSKNPEYKDGYNTFMNDMLNKGQAKQSNPDERGHWYVPHHAVFHPHKPGKIRVVFDCSAEHKGTSLNKVLMSGPDLTNSIVGVLLRFRQDKIAIMADIEKMFYQVHVPKEHQNYLRFLWWPEGDTAKQPVDYQMTVHLFGASSSPSCANFALRRTAYDNEAKFGTEAKMTLMRNFYVDDLLKSVHDVDTGVHLVNAVKGMCKEGGFNLTKFVSNSKELMEYLPDAEKSTSGIRVDLLNHSTLVERALGVSWIIENDSLSFKIELKDKLCTRRGILSSISSIYDPLGLAAPFLLKGKMLLQSLCGKQLGWDDELDSDFSRQWNAWRTTLPLLEKIRVDRCYIPKGFGSIKSATLHNFSDASQSAYGVGCYLRLVDDNNKIHSSLIFGKSRVAPNKPITVPRLELAAATVSAKIGKMLSKELDYSNITSYYWTDSKAVLGFISNDAKRYHTFVANRVQQIRENTEVSSWRHVKTIDNPADDASRGLKCHKISCDHRWFTGPSFLWQQCYSY